MIGQRVKYNKDMSGIIIDENSTHVVIQFDKGNNHCILKSGIEEKQIKLCGNCKYYTQNPILKDRGWCDFDKVISFILWDRHCDRWENHVAQQKLF